MSALQNNLLALVTGSLIVAFRMIWLVRRIWNQPLDHGRGYFLGVAVEPGFYEGAGVRWLRRYHALMLAQHLLLVSVFAAVVISGRWSRMPVIAPVDVVSFFAVMGGFTWWTRRVLGTAPVTFSRVAVPLQARRLGQYISWPIEALLFILLAASWLLLLTSAHPQTRWESPVVSTYVILGVLTGKLVLARTGFPLPPERTEEHFRWMEASRRHSLRVMDAMRWLVLVILLGYAVQHGWAPAQSMPWIRWLFLGIAGAVCLAMLIILVRGGRRLAAMGRDLRPPGSWKGPFRPAAGMFMRGGLAWGIGYCAGLLILMVWFHG